MDGYKKDSMCVSVWMVNECEGLTKVKRKLER